MGVVHGVAEPVATGAGRAGAASSRGPVYSPGPVQLSQAVGMAVFGGVYLARGTAKAGTLAHVAGHAPFVTLSLIAVILARGVAAAVPLARTVRAAMRQVP